MIESIEAVVALIGAIIGLATTVTLLAAKLTKNTKLLTFANRLEYYNEKIPALMAEVEGFTQMSGSEKKRWVINSLEAHAKMQGWDIDLDIVGQLIETYVAFSKSVNAKGA